MRPERQSQAHLQRERQPKGPHGQERVHVARSRRLAAPLLLRRHRARRLLRHRQHVAGGRRRLFGGQRQSHDDVGARYERAAAGQRRPDERVRALEPAVHAPGGDRRRRELLRRHGCRRRRADDGHLVGDVLDLCTRAGGGPATEWIVNTSRRKQMAAPK